MSGHEGTQELFGGSSNIWTANMLRIYRDRATPLLKTVNVKKVEELAQEKMKDNMGTI